MSTNASLRTCPSCGARNSSFSLFCAECGTSLDEPETDDTSAYRPLTSEGDSQATAAFTPAPTSHEPESRPAPVDAQATRAAPPIRSTVQPYAPGWDAETSPEPAWHDPAVEHRTLTIGARPESMRGFFLGALAVLLILAVFGAWAWAAVLTDGARDSIRDFFGFIS